MIERESFMQSNHISLLAFHTSTITGLCFLGKKLLYFLSEETWFRDFSYSMEYIIMWLSFWSSNFFANWGEILAENFILEIFFYFWYRFETVFKCDWGSDEIDVIIIIWTNFMSMLITSSRSQHFVLLGRINLSAQDHLGSPKLQSFYKYLKKHYCPQYKF